MAMTKKKVKDTTTKSNYFQFDVSHWLFPSEKLSLREKLAIMKPFIIRFKYPMGEESTTNIEAMGESGAKRIFEFNYPGCLLISCKELKEEIKKPSGVEWIEEQKFLPDIDTSDDYNKENGISKNVLLYLPKWGTKFGRYFHKLRMWKIQGIHSFNDIEVSHWMPLT